MTAIAVGLQVAGSAAGFAGKQSQTKAYNAAADQNAINASIAATRQYQDEGFKKAADAKATNNEGYDAEMKARQSMGTAKASAGTSGLDLGSVSVNSILSNIDSEAARSEAAVADRHENEDYNYRGQTKAIEAQAQGRINSMPYKEGPSALGLALKIGTDVFGGFSKATR